MKEEKDQKLMVFKIKDQDMNKEILDNLEIFDLNTKEIEDKKSFS
jgi:hypothetical protein